MKKIIFALIIFTLTAFGFPPITFAENIDLHIESPSAILMERDTGKILFNKNSDKPLPPASMTKIMTMILIMEELDKESITLTEKVRASERAASMW